MKGITITIKDVAQKANVSIATVSRVLNRSKPVSAAVREKVLQTVEELGFKPNSVARSLIMKESLLIGVLIPDISNAFFSNFVRGVNNECFKANYSTLLCDTQGNLETELHYLQLMKEKYVDGVIILSSSPNKKQKYKEFFEVNSIPVVFASHYDQDEEKFSSINIDEFQAFYDAVQYLIGLGHREIAMFSGDLNYYDSGIIRYEGYKKALSDAGIEYNPDWFWEGDYDVQSGYERAKKLFSLKDRPTALCCVSDMVAIGAIRAAEEMGFRIPQDLSIIGFDDVPIAEVYRPSITTVHQPIFDMGMQSVQMLLNLLKDKENMVNEAKIVPHKIIERESCAKLIDSL
ncbi:LacI family DNA-binding transcriptional regulator [Niallia sp. 01092]|uniref:LacI family DNA-binding transcriptional regulator n=1 Tax=unclassified Niallia TaxID=2837522 RepID=UPI003FD68CE0